ncbi:MULTISPECIES: hypothetical protein [Kribbella]|nr:MULTISPECIES: hypothetical protein [Kribbella]
MVELVDRLHYRERRGLHPGALVPSVVIDEFKRNRPRIEQSMTASVSERFRLIKRDLDDFGGAGVEHALQVLDELAHQVPLIGAMTTRNFDENP